MAVKKSLEVFLKELSEVNENIEYVSGFVNMSTKAYFKCLLDGYIWDVKPSQLLQGHGCPKCAGMKLHNLYSRTHKQFLEEMAQINDKIEVLSEYYNEMTKVQCRCKIDGNVWYALPNKLLKGEGCPECCSSTKLTHDEFCKKVKDFDILSEYKSARSNIKCRCHNCNSVITVKARNLIEGSGCPVCKESKGEQRLRRYFNDNNIDFESQKTFDNLVGVGGKLLRFDFYLPEYNVLIEYQGEFHNNNIPNNFQSKSKYLRQVEHDNRKKIFSQNNGFGFIEIWYWDYENIENILDKYLRKEDELCQKMIM